MSKLNKQIKDYLKEIKNGIPCSFNTKHAFILMFKQKINEYLCDNPNADFTEIESYFGTAESIINEYDVDEYKADLKRKKFHLLITEIVAILLLFASIFLTIIFLDARNDGYYVIDTDSYVEIN